MIKMDRSARTLEEIRQHVAPIQQIISDNRTLLAGAAHFSSDVRRVLELNDTITRALAELQSM